MIRKKAVIVMLKFNKI
jgi:AP-4 complex subunit epsilon-1